MSAYLDGRAKKMEIQVATKSEPRTGASEGKLSHRSLFSRGRVFSPATALSAHELEAV